MGERERHISDGSEDKVFRKKKVWSMRKKRVGKKKRSEDQKNSGRSTRRPGGSADYRGSSLYVSYVFDLSTFPFVPIQRMLHDATFGTIFTFFE